MSSLGDAERPLVGRAAVVGHSEGMRLRRHAPDARLRELVLAYWEYETYKDAGPELNHDLPERTVYLMFSAEPVRFGPSADALRPLPPITLTPFVMEPHQMVGQGKLRALMVDLYPYAARQLLR